jgi:chaperonin cofactor prefoldin
MDDDLVKYLPSTRLKEKDALIEELNNHCCELEADLEKAVSALEEVQEFVRDLAPYADQGHTLVPALQKACETLNELKGHGR